MPLACPSLYEETSFFAFSRPDAETKRVLRMHCQLGEAKWAGGIAVYLPHQQLVRWAPVIELTSDRLFRLIASHDPSRYQDCTGNWGGHGVQEGRQTCCFKRPMKYNQTDWKHLSCDTASAERMRRRGRFNIDEVKLCKQLRYSAIGITKAR